MPHHHSGAPSLPFKANQDRRHRIPKQRHRVINWSEYEAGLRARGSLTVWFTAEAIEAWRAEPRTTRGGQRRYSGLAIATALTPCCTDRPCGRTEPYPCPGSRDADVLRASEVEHAVQHAGGDGHLGLLTPVRP